MTKEKPDISAIICGKLRDIIDIYPVVANIEDQTKIKMPWAVYRIEESEELTKDQAYSVWNAALFIASDSHDTCLQLAGQCRAALDTLKADQYIVDDVTTKVTFDQDDRAYIAELSLTIKE